MKWNGTCSLVLNCNLMSRHIGGGHFVWQPQEEQDTESDNATGHCLSLITSIILIDDQWCWPSRGPGPLSACLLEPIPTSQRLVLTGKTSFKLYILIPITGADVEHVYIHTFVSLLPFHLKVDPNCRKQKHVYFLAYHPGGVQWKSQTVAAF